MAIKWYEWDSWELFNQWHDALCVALDYPHDGYNQLTGELDENATKTAIYTDGHEVENKIIAIVEDEHSTGLELTQLRIPSPVIETTK